MSMTSQQRDNTCMTVSTQRTRTHTHMTERPNTMNPAQHTEQFLCARGRSVTVCEVGRHDTRQLRGPISPTHNITYYSDRYKRRAFNTPFATPITNYKEQPTSPNKTISVGTDPVSASGYAEPVSDYPDAASRHAERVKDQRDRPDTANGLKETRPKTSYRRHSDGLITNNESHPQTKFSDPGRLHHNRCRTAGPIGHLRGQNGVDPHPRWKARDHTPATPSGKLTARKNRRMSAPEFPPIVDYQGRTPRLSESSGKRHSLTGNSGNNQPALRTDSKVQFTTLTPSKVTSSLTGTAGAKKKDTFHRNSSEPNFSRLLMKSSTISLDSVSSNISVHNADLSAGNASKQARFLSNESGTLSWSTAYGSQTKLETLFESMVQHHGDVPAANSSSAAPYVRSGASSEASTDVSINANNVVYDSNNNASHNAGELISVSLRSRKDTSMLRFLDHKGQQPRGRMHRSNSEHKAVGNPQTIRDLKSQRGLLNHSSDRINTLGVSQQLPTKSVPLSKPGPHRSVRRESNLSLMNNNANYNGNKHENVRTELQVLMNRSRIEEWLEAVSQVDRFDADPKDDVFEYMDEVPQTDTAIHLVYQGRENIS